MDKHQAPNEAVTRLAFFFSYGGSLAKWRREGILSREIRVLEAYLERGTYDEIVLFSYDPGDRAIVDELRQSRPAFARVRILPPPPMLTSRLLFSLIGPLYHRNELARANVLRTNQISGSWSSVIAKWLTHRPLALRLGYILSRRQQLNGQKVRSRISTVLEALAFSAADAVIVTSDLARETVQKAVSAPDKVHLVPTYVDVATFVAKSDYHFDRPFLYVGRLTPQKNLPSLIRACASMGHPLHIVGTGEQQTELERLAQEVGCALTFLGKVPNEDLSELMRDYTIFVLPSLHEGLPKALIEAMASGMVCVGTDVPGTADIINDGQNGYLAADTSEQAIEATLVRAVREGRADLGAAARQTAKDRYSLEVYVANEATVLRGISSTPPQNSAAPGKVS